MDKIGPISEIRANLPRVVDEVAGKRKRYIVTRQGKAVCIMISPEELETLEIKADPELIRSLIRAEEDVRAGRLYTHRDVFGV